MKYQQEKKKRKKIVVQNIIPISKQINTLIVSYPDSIFIRDRCNRAIFTSLFSLVYLSGIKYRKIRGEENFYTYTRIINIEGKRVSKRVCVYTVEETGEGSLVSSKQGANVSGIIICKPRHYIPRNTCVSRGVFALPSNRYRRKTEGGVGEARFLGAASGGK